MDKPVFSVSGFPLNFFKSPLGKKRENLFEWIESQGLDGIEIQCTYGIRMKEEQALLYHNLAEQHGLTLTMHAPYYISLASTKKEVVERSKEEIVKAYILAEQLGVHRIIFHPGGGYGNTPSERREGIQRLIVALNEIKPKLATENIKIYPEIGGKVNQLGSLDEIIEICKNVDYARPCIDLAHLHAREFGSMDSKDKIVAVLKKIEEELGRTILEETHFHVYPVSYTDKGEKAHKKFGETEENPQLSLFEEPQEFMPRAKDYIAALKEVNLAPITVCEAHDTQDIGAKLMKDLYYNKDL